MSITTTLNGFGNDDLAQGEARVYNHYTKTIIMSVDVDGMSMDAAFGLVMDKVTANIRPDVLVDIEIDQMPYDEAKGRL